MKKTYLCEFDKLMSEWDWEENNKYGLDPYKITAGSSKKVHWICEKGHKWVATISNRTRGTSCPYCSNKKVLQGYNDLQTTNPILCMEWNYSKNGNLKPTDVMAGSCKKVWWICIKGHEWEAIVSDRNRGSGCPECAKERHTSFQEQAFYYYLNQSTAALNRANVCGKEIDIYLPDINVGVEYNGSYYHSKTTDRDEEKLTWLRDHGINMFVIKECDSDGVNENVISYRFGKSLDWAIITLFSMLKLNIPPVNTNIDRIKIWEQYVLLEKENSLAKKYPELAQEWHPTKNGKLTPDLISYGSSKVVWWLGKCGHEWDMSVDHRTSGCNCPICSGRRIVSGVNDLGTTHPHLLNEWDYEKNTEISPDQITFGSNKKIWWKCSLGHSYLMRVHHKVAGIGCPVCSGHILLKGYNDLATRYPQLLAEWDYKKNTISPDEVFPGSKNKAWWKCVICGYEWQASINNRTTHSTGCPACSSIKQIVNISDTKNTSGVTGVHWHQKSHKWHAIIQYNKQPISLKCFDNKDDAIRARLQAEVKYYGENAPQRHLFEQYGIEYKGGDSNE